MLTLQHTPIPPSPSRYPRAAFLAMDRELVFWGKVLLQGAKGTIPETEPDETVRKTVWTAQDEARAWNTDRLVRALEPRPRIIVRTFYRAREAAYWEDLEPKDQHDLETLLCREANARWRGYCCEVQELPRTIRGYHFRAIREAAVRQLAEATCAKPGNV